MTPFAYRRPTSIPAAIDAIGSAPNVSLLAGGTCLIDLMKQGVQQPTTIVDLNFVNDLSGVTVLRTGSLRVGATTTLSHVARHADVARSWPLLRQTILGGLTPQLRNAASFGGNIMQRPRCIYFREADFACNKKRPGSGCAAQTGVHYQHAIFGGDAASACIAVHPSDLCVALHVLKAVVLVKGPGGERRLPIHRLHRLPQDDATRETTLEDREMIVAVEVPPQRGRHAAYVKGTEGFTLASCAAHLQIEDGVIYRAGIVLGGVAHMPWRCEPAEKALEGGRPETAAFRRAADAAIAGATTDSQTAFRVKLLHSVIVEALERAAGEKDSKS